MASEHDYWSEMYNTATVTRETEDIKNINAKVALIKSLGGGVERVFCENKKSYWLVTMPGGVQEFEDESLESVMQKAWVTL